MPRSPSQAPYPVVIATILTGLLLTGCGGGGGDGSIPSAETDPEVVSVYGECESGAVVELPCEFPLPREQADNPLSAEKITLGRLLFYDRNMSFNQTQSCGDCHQQDKAFTDGLTVSVGSEGHMHARNAMSMTNVVYNGTQNWVNSTILNLTEQAHAVITNEEPIELGWVTRERQDQILARLTSPDPADYAGTPFSTSAPDYPALFAAAFPDQENPVSVASFTRAIAAFGSTFISGDSDFDKFNRGEPNGMTDAAKRGRELFFSERLECFHCHNGFNFSDSVDHAGNQFTHNNFHNNGLYNIDGDGDGNGDGHYPADNRGLIIFTLRAEDEGKFRAPTLRNIQMTAPYMHDGTIATLDEVIDHYARGGRLISAGPNAGDGKDNPFKSDFVKGFLLTADERLDLLAFLESLTDWDFLCRDSLSDPFGVIPKHNLCP
jgi:cytochrome c peroxidase